MTELRNDLKMVQTRSRRTTGRPLRSFMKNHRGVTSSLIHHPTSSSRANQGGSPAHFSISITEIIRWLLISEMVFLSSSVHGPFLRSFIVYIINEGKAYYLKRTRMNVFIFDIFIYFYELFVFSASVCVCGSEAQNPTEM